MAAIAWLLLNGTQKLGYHWQWYRVPQYIFSAADNQLAAGPLVEGLWVTFRLTAISLILAFLFGLTSAIMRLSRSWLGRITARGYLEIIRNTPLLVQLFFVYFVLSPVLNISGFASAVLALSLFEGAYASEIFRAANLSVGYFAPGDSAYFAALDQPGRLAHQRFRPGQCHRYLRSDNAGSGDYRPDLFGI
jgi:polar amino acid transport system permease protein